MSRKPAAPAAVAGCSRIAAHDPSARGRPTPPVGAKDDCSRRDTTSSGTSARNRLGTP